MLLHLREDFNLYKNVEVLLICQPQFIYFYIFLSLVFILIFILVK